MYNTTIQRAELKGMVLEVSLDLDATNPREWSDPVSRMLCFHGRYDLGDKLDYSEDDYSSWTELRKGIEDNENVVIMKPMYMYDHSGITVSTTPFSCGWDSGQIGWIWLTEEAIRENYGEVSEDNIEKATKALLAEVEEDDAYVRGDVYQFTLYEKVTCKCCNHTELHHVDGCAGFYGYKDLQESIKENIAEDWKHIVDLLEDVY